MIYYFQINNLTHSSKGQENVKIALQHNADVREDFLSPPYGTTLCINFAFVYKNLHIKVPYTFLQAYYLLYFVIFIDEQSVGRITLYNHHEENRSFTSPGCSYVRCRLGESTVWFRSRRSLL